MKVSMRLTLAVALCLLASVASAQAREPSSYFAPPKAAAESALKLPPPLPAKAAAALPPLELPPLPAPRAASPTPKAQPAARQEQPATKIEANERTKPSAEKLGAEKPNDGSPFLSRSVLEEKRRACKVEPPASRSLHANPRGGVLTVKLRQTAGEGCLSAASADAAWVEASINSRIAEITLLVEANDADSKRTSTINVLAGNDTFLFSVEQASLARGCRRAAFVRRSSSAIPEGFEP